jgi:hypothetical protein
MANFSLLELNQNDELPTVIKKSNMNFRNLGWALKQKIQQATDGSSAEWKQAIADLRDETEQEVSMLTKTINALSDQLTAAEATMEKMVPPVGSVLFQWNPVNPNTMYPGTTWERYAKYHTIGVGSEVYQAYKNPLDADGNKMNWSSLGTSTENENGILFLVGWRRTA